MLRRLFRMLIKEFLQMLRDPRMRVVIFGMPVIQMTIMAFALTTDVTDVSLAVLDMDKTPASRELVSAFTAGNYFRISKNLASQNEITPLLDRSEVRARAQHGGPGHPRPRDRERHHPPQAERAADRRT